MTRWVVLTPAFCSCGYPALIQLVDGTYRDLVDVHRCPVPPVWIGSRRQAQRRARRVTGDPARPFKVDAWLMR